MAAPLSFGATRLPSFHIIAQLLFVASTFALELKDGLRIDVTRPVECTRKTHVGDVVSVHYKGTLDDGTVFDASYNRGMPITFPVGAGRVIKGWDDGLLDMCIGEARLLTIPPELGYGHRNMGKIPPDSTLTFETELVGIKGVVADPKSSPQDSPDPAADKDAPAPSTEKNEDKEKKPSDGDKGDCKLLGPFALVVQATLGLLALGSLVFKRWRESPRRPLKIWFFDVSKQVFGSALLHVFNVFMSILSSGALELSNQRAAVNATGSNWEPNPCSFYLINIAVDTTLGVPILFMILKVLHHAALLTPLANPPESIKTGHYGQPPNAIWWLKQSCIYFVGLLLMKLCVFALFEILPVIVWVGNWALRWTEGNQALQIGFVMFLFPLIANSVQYYVIDSFIKDRGSGHEAVASHDHDDEDDEFRQPLQPEREGSFDQHGILRPSEAAKDDEDAEDRRRR